MGHQGSALAKEDFTSVNGSAHREQARPFVKWAGGKRALVPQILSVLPKRITRYHEPFVGGGALYFAVEPRTRQAFLSDANNVLITAYKAIQDYVEEVISLLEHHAKRHGKEYYVSVRKKQVTAQAEVAAKLIYLNRTCFNGLYRVNSKGEFNVPMGRYENPMICDPENLRNVSFALQKARLSSDEFDKAKVRKGDVVYCDPPYDETYNQYTTLRFESDMQRKLARKAGEWRDIGATVVISNSNTPLIRRLYKETQWKLIKVQAPRNINCNGDGRQPATELIITNA